MNIVILDDYQDVVRKLNCASKLEAFPAKVYTNTIKGVGQLSVRLRDAEVLVLIRERTHINRQLLASGHPVVAVEPNAAMRGAAEQWLAPQYPQFRAVDGISFSVGHGESVGLVGESGCGKSTTSMMVMRLLDQTSGRIMFDGALRLFNEVG